MNRLIYDKSAPENIINHNRSSLSQTIFLVAFFIYHTLEIIRNYISLENLKSQNSSFETHFKIRHRITMEMENQNHVTKCFRSWIIQI